MCVVVVRVPLMIALACLYRLAVTSHRQLAEGGNTEVVVVGGGGDGGGGGGDVSGCGVKWKLQTRPRSDITETFLLSGEQTERVRFHLTCFSSLVVSDTALLVYFQISIILQ